LVGRGSAQTFTTIYTFTGGNDGGNPQAGLILSGNTLYGTAFGDGSLSGGTVFMLNIDGTGFMTLHSFAGTPSDGANPQAGLILSGNTLFGTASSGGSSGNGTVFKLNTDGSGYMTLYAFPLSNDYAAAPEAGLMLSGNTLYGTTSRGGNFNIGTVFKVNADGSGFFGVHEFNDDFEGANPFAGVILSGRWLYGTTQQGGYSSDGTVFGITNNGPSGYALETLHSFTPLSVQNPSTNSDGANPVAGLVLSGTTLYGTASAGGSSANGTVFKLNAESTAFNVLHTFSPTTASGANSDGANPHAGLILSGSTLYGTTLQGGSSGSGTVFAVSTNGTGFTNLYNFTGGNDGANPMAGLVLAGNTLYGTTSAGGGEGFGTVFSLSLGPVTPPQLTIIPAGTNVVLMWTNTASGFTLQSTTNLFSPVWTTNLPSPVVVNGQNTVTNPISRTQQFFRLSQ
jgi:uncharacterized repeat protein (TIGR03803 family)